ncbi:MAG: N-formylglutamate deformylase [Gammaproteobacteria bacterium]|jgi:N-formylglutamate amidohydrolase|nr:N-formylglutamate deformylase [Gammaproteobacteria bacterium]
MSLVFRHHGGDLPLLISVPHDGREIPADIRSRMTDVGKSIPDTDWDVARLYDFATDLGASTVVANYSRYVVDLNRSAADVALYPGQVATGLCPEQTFAGEPIYHSGDVDAEEKAVRIEKYWRPYHEHIQTTLASLRDEHGFALLWDAHSIPSIVPRLFAGELPELNLGSNSGAGCESSIEAAVAAEAHKSPFAAVVNGRFKGGYITRHYGKPENGIHALQLEIAQRAYMNEETGLYDTKKASVLRDILQQMLKTFLDAAQTTTKKL